MLSQPKGKNPICCGVESVWVAINPDCTYYYCRTCKKEIDPNPPAGPWGYSGQPTKRDRAIAAFNGQPIPSTLIHGATPSNSPTPAGSIKVGGFTITPINPTGISGNGGITSSKPQGHTFISLMGTPCCMDCGITLHDFQTKSPNLACTGPQPKTKTSGSQPRSVYYVNGHEFITDAYGVDSCRLCTELFQTWSLRHGLCPKPKPKTNGVANSVSSHDWATLTGTCQNCGVGYSYYVKNNYPTCVPLAAANPLIKIVPLIGSTKVLVGILKELYFDS